MLIYSRVVYETFDNPTSLTVIDYTGPSAIIPISQSDQVTSPVGTYIQIGTAVLTNYIAATNKLIFTLTPVNAIILNTLPTTAPVTFVVINSETADYISVSASITTDKCQASCSVEGLIQALSARTIQTNGTFVVQYKSTGNTMLPACNPTSTVITYITSQAAAYAIQVTPVGDGFNNSYYLMHNEPNSDAPSGILATSTSGEISVEMMNDRSPTLATHWYMIPIATGSTTCAIMQVPCSAISECAKALCLTYTTIYQSHSILALQPFTGISNQLWTINYGAFPPFNGVPINKNAATLSQRSYYQQQAGEHLNESNLQLNEENDNKLMQILNLIGANVQQLNGQPNGRSGGTPSNPIKINLSLSDSSSTLIKSAQKFTDVAQQQSGGHRHPQQQPTRDTFQDVRTLLDNYINNEVTPVEAAYHASTCPNYNDYTLNRVGECNCNLSDLQGT
jgi:hypothetical protein